MKKFAISATTLLTAANVPQTKQSAALKVYPNPALTSVIFQSPKPITHLALFDITGVCVYKAGKSGNTTTIDVAQLPPGMYTYIVESEYRTERGKLVIQ